MKDNELLEEIFLSEHHHKQVFDGSASSVFRDLLSSLACQGKRRLSTGFGSFDNMLAA